MSLSERKHRYVVALQRQQRVKAPWLRLGWWSMTTAAVLGTKIGSNSRERQNKADTDGLKVKPRWDIAKN
jgi:hypothetical protein